MIFPAPHGGYPGEVIVQDEYLACPVCAIVLPLDQGDDDCWVCTTPLVVRRAYPPVEPTLSLL